jgi:hypothetical protein
MIRYRFVVETFGRQNDTLAGVDGDSSSPPPPVFSATASPSRHVRASEHESEGKSRPVATGPLLSAETQPKRLYRLKQPASQRPFAALALPPRQNIRQPKNHTGVAWPNTTPSS